jgi:hypothetical protein
VKGSAQEPAKGWRYDYPDICGKMHADVYVRVYLKWVRQNRVRIRKIYYTLDPHRRTYVRGWSLNDGNGNLVKGRDDWIDGSGYTIKKGQTARRTLRIRKTVVWGEQRQIFFHVLFFQKPPADAPGTCAESRAYLYLLPKWD